MATAFTLARILSNIPLSRGGPSSVVIFDIHALQVRLVLVILILRLQDCTLLFSNSLACLARIAVLCSVKHAEN